MPAVYYSIDYLPNNSPALSPRERALRDHNRALALLERAVFEYCGIPLPEIAADINGKPFFPAYPELHFSYSHTEKIVMCALSASPVGADCELRRELKDGVPRRFAAPSELERYDFFELWTMRESLYKLNGRGNLLVSDFAFSSAGDTEKIIVPGDPEISFWLIPDIPGCAACVCERGSAKREGAYEILLDIS